MFRLSTVAVSILRPALKVLSTTLPDLTCLTFVRTKAGPLPGLTCWNSTTDHSSPPSSLRTRPFFSSFVVATRVSVFPSSGRRALEDEQLLGGLCEEFRSVRPDHQGVLDANA